MTIISPSTPLKYTLSGPGSQRKAYVHVAQISGYRTGPASGATLNFRVREQAVQLREGDGLYVYAPAGAELVLENTGDRKAEVLLFNLDD